MAQLVPRLPFSLDPLMAEAKRRMRRRRGLVAAVALVLAAGATGLGLELSSRGADSAGGRSSTSLRLLVNGPLYEGRGVFHLNCNPPGGNLPDPAAACALIAGQSTAITRPKFSSCLEPNEVTFVGRLNGKPVESTITTCWASQARLIRNLGVIPSGG
jgi:hypothetical protein